MEYTEMFLIIAVIEIGFIIWQISDMKNLLFDFLEFLEIPEDEEE